MGAPQTDVLSIEEIPVNDQVGLAADDDLGTQRDIRGELDVGVARDGVDGGSVDDVADGVVGVSWCLRCCR